MPRPGPRPYECVRRAWHSDRHQPVRASLIHHLFRLASEAHSLPTQQNAEYREKLPTVILRTEEILYSKANSEAEYADLNTLWARANSEGVDTIVRRDEGEESGDLLLPCIEAALILGCVPRRASRSQRYSNPSCYLSPNEPLERETNTSNSQPSQFLIHNSTSNSNQIVLTKPSPIVNHGSPNSVGPTYPIYFQPPIVNRGEKSVVNKEENKSSRGLGFGGFDCDLSLRLGIASPLDSSCSEDLEDVESTSSYA